MSPQILVPLLAPAASPAAVRRGAAMLLQRASLALARAARHVESGRRPPPVEASSLQLEFHAEAGAPEGALYADGLLVAVLPGISRL